MLPSTPVLLSLLATTLCLPAQDRGEDPGKRWPNIVFILADDLGYGDLGCFGQTRIQTPRLDRMAAQGVRLTDFYAGSTVCAPSRCVLMTGLHSGHARIRGNSRLPLLDEDLTVAEVLKQRGYRTALYGKWGLGEVGSSGAPHKQGFDEFYGYINQRHAHNYYPTHLWRLRDGALHKEPLENVVPKEDKVGAGKASVKKQYSHDLIMAEALSFVSRQRRGSPFFLYLALTIPHANNEAGRAGMEVPELGAYADKDWPAPQKGTAAMITRMDRDVGRLLDRLAQRGLAEDTLVIFTSDNGPHREGGNNPDFFDSNGPLRGIKRDLYEGGIRVPAIAWWPGKLSKGRVSDHICGFVDFFATACELSGASLPQGLDSQSFLPALDGTFPILKDYHYWEFYERGSAQALRKGRYKAVRKPMLSGEVQLFDLKADIGEQRDIAKDKPELVAELTALMDKAHRPDPQWQVRKPRRRGKGKK